MITLISAGTTNSVAANMKVTNCEVVETEDSWGTKVNLGLFATQSRERS